MTELKAATCRICVRPKGAASLLLRGRWKLLPREMLVPFIPAKARAVAWLRKHYDNQTEN
jgi:hypothetical protein